MPVKPPISAAMLVMVARSSTPSASMASPEYSMTLASALPLRMYSSESSLRMKSLAVTFGALLAANDDLHRLRNFHPHVFGEPGIKDIRRADAEGDAAHRADVRGMRVRADVELAGQGIALGHDGVADAFRALAVRELAVQLDAARLGEVLLLQL